VQANYRLELGALGSLNATLNGSYLEHATTTPVPGGPSFDCAGLFGPNCAEDAINPRWRHTLRVSWQTPWSKLLLSANWRFIGATSVDNNSPNSYLRFSELGAYDSIDGRIPNYSYLDLAAIWPVWRGIELRAGATNVLDKSPPIVGYAISGTGSPNSYPTYDLLGRELYVAFTARL
jgi:outer membrane receptor protein involved in Fe transport